MTNGELHEAIHELNELFDRIKPLSQRVARLMAGRLRDMGLDRAVLVAFKRELASFDMGRKCWK